MGNVINSDAITPYLCSLTCIRITASSILRKWAFLSGGGTLKILTYHTYSIKKLWTAIGISQVCQHYVKLLSGMALTSSGLYELHRPTCYHPSYDLKSNYLIGVNNTQFHAIHAILGAFFHSLFKKAPNSGNLGAIFNFFF